jgi:hypothetical protein
VRGWHMRCSWHMPCIWRRHPTPRPTQRRPATSLGLLVDDRGCAGKFQDLDRRDLVDAAVHVDPHLLEADALAVPPVRAQEVRQLGAGPSCRTRGT